jgi:hypothetical protein
MHPHWLALPLVLLASGCGDEVQRQFEDRAELPACGRVNAGLHRDWRDTDPEAWECFADALAAGQDAELRVDFLTDEGDPIPTWYRLDEDRLEIYEDATEDSFGSGEWMFSTCSPPERLGRTISCG